MKVLMVNKFLYPAGGAETYVFKLGKYLEEHGCQVEYFGMYHPENTAGNSLGLYGKAVNFHRKGILSNMINPLKVIYSPDARKKISRILEKFRPDVMHVNNFNYQLTPSILEAADKYRKKTQRKLKIIYTAHDSQLVCPNHYLYHPGAFETCEKCLGGRYINCILSRCIHGSATRSCLGAAEASYWKMRNVYAVFDTILCPSIFMKEKLDTNPVLAPKTVFIRNFVRPVKREKKEKGRYVLYFGRYSEEKGVRMLLDVCKELRDVPFIFAGAGPLENLLLETENVRNVGFLKDEELDQLIRGARFTVVPSVCSENCPFSVMESITDHTPVLGAERGGIPELIEEGKTGWLFPAGDSNMLRKRIEEIWYSEEPEIFSGFCQNVYFDSINEYGKKIMKIYETHWRGEPSGRKD